MSVFVATQIKLGSSHTIAYLTLGLAQPVLCVTALPSATLFDIVARLVPRKRLYHRCPNWSSALRATGHADDLLSTGSGIGRVLADFRR